jgi:hypothetical protein
MTSENDVVGKTPPIVWQQIISCDIPSHEHENFDCEQIHFRFWPQRNADEPEEETKVTNFYLTYLGRRLNANEQIPSGQPFNAGGEITLTAVVEPANAANYTITWASSNANTVAVDENGVVSLLRPGNEIITATLTDHDNNDRVFTARTRVNVRAGNAGNVDVTPDPDVEEPVIFHAVIVEATEGYNEIGVKFAWPTVEGIAWYRLFRSTVQGERGISVTDFPINVQGFVDVNVNSNTTYYYTVYPVLQEADREGNPEVLGDPSDQISVTTLDLLWDDDDIISPDPELVRNVMLMKIGDPNMSVNGIGDEVDPGRGTAPVLLRNRTFVPIRAIVEAMGGDVDWEEAERKVTLEFEDLARDEQNTVEMWLGSRDIITNGEEREMDVAPEVINDRTMVPIRFAIENLGCFVAWIGSTQEIVIVFFSY